MALLCLAALTLCAAPARAGHWVLSASGSSATGTASPTPPSQPAAWQAPDPTITGTITLPAYGQSGYTDGVVTTGPTSAQATMTVKVNGTWTADGSGDDTAPPSVMVCVTSTAYAVQNDGYGNSVGSVSDGVGTSQPDPATGVVSDSKYFTFSGGSIPVSLTLSASASGSPGPFDPGDPPTCNSNASVGQVTVTVHAQPYNFTRVPGQSVKGNDGSIDWTYAYSSSDGNIAHLTSCYWHEYVTYPGPVGTPAQSTHYLPPNPPFNYSASAGQYIPNPYVNPGTGNQGGVMTSKGSYPIFPGQGNIYDLTLVPAFVAPSLLTPGGYTGTQVFQFDDIATGQSNIQIPGPDSGPWSIVRNVQLLNATDDEYVVTKEGVTNTLLLPISSGP